MTTATPTKPKPKQSTIERVRELAKDIRENYRLMIIGLVLGKSIDPSTLAKVKAAIGVTDRKFEEDIERTELRFKSAARLAAAEKLETEIQNRQPDLKAADKKIADIQKEYQPKLDAAVEEYRSIEKELDGLRRDAGFEREGAAGQLRSSASEAATNAIHEAQRIHGGLLEYWNNTTSPPKAPLDLAEDFARFDQQREEEGKKFDASKLIARQPVIDAYEKHVKECNAWKVMRVDLQATMVVAQTRTEDAAAAPLKPENVALSINERRPEANQERNERESHERQEAMKLRGEL